MPSAVNPPVKARIIKIGTFDADGNPVDWEFDGLGVVSALHIDPPGYPAGTLLIAGYTSAELRAIAANIR